MTGRFINADGAVNANMDIKSANLFVYCGNNPVNNSDPCGTHYGPISDQEIIDFMNRNGDGNYTYLDLIRDLAGDNNWEPDIIDEVNDKVEDMVKQINTGVAKVAAKAFFLTHNYNFSLFGIGLQGSAECGGGICLSVCVVFDRNGNAAVQASIGLGGGINIGFSVGGFTETSDAPNISDLEKWSFCYGISGGEGITGAEYHGFTKDTNYSFDMLFIGFGGGVLIADPQAFATYTWTLYSFKAW